MIAAKVETTVQNDGELHLTQLPCRKGDRVEAIVLLLEKDTAEEREKLRDEARQRFLDRARASAFCSTAAYPTRDELHERH
jgi:hypothetical protein